MMPDLVEGKLVWRGEKNKRRRFVVVPGKSGSAQFPISQSELSTDLQNNDADEVSVQAERDGSGRPVVKVRSANQEFQPSAAAVTDKELPHGSIYEAARQRERERGRRERTSRPTDRGREPRNDRRQQTLNTEMKEEFHNPYNFIPAPDRERIEGELGDHSPHGHDCYHSNLFSGKLRVKLLVKTPLLIPDSARV
ncbi:MAG: hypothetical protein ACREBC_21280, partial [Pyrinomonadaceae bacterium]